MVEDQGKKVSGGGSADQVVSPRIIRTKTRLSLLPCQVQRDEACKDIVTVVPPCKTATFWNRVEQVESEWILCNCDYLSWILNRMPRSFQGFFFRPKPHLLVICT
jgi:hypothetical protein